MKIAVRVVLLFILPGLAHLGCGGPGGSSANEGGREAASRFLEDLRAGRYQPAWEGTSPEFKSLMGLENLRDYIKAHPALKGPAEHVESRDAPRGGHAMVEHVFRGNARVRGKTVPATVKVLVAFGHGNWGVEHVSVE